jgi:hypothetical protein
MARQSPELYLAFPDGIFDYACSGCNAFCCRGYGFGGSLKREMRSLFVLYPALENMAVMQEGDYIEFATPANGCILLDQDNRCRIEKESGKERKPSVCRLFPFNSFSRIGDVVAVRPHFLCPLRLQFPSRPGEVEGTHQTIAQTVTKSGILDEVYVDLHVPRLSMHPSLDAESVVCRETVFRDRCSEAIGKRTFGDVLRAESGDSTHLNTFIKRAARLMGLNSHPVAGSNDATDDLLLALATPFRLELLELSSTSIVRALAMGELLLRRVLLLSADPLSAKGAFSILERNGGVLRLMARGDEPVELSKKASFKSPKFGDPDLTFAAFVALREIQAGTPPLDALDRAISPSLQISARSVLIYNIATLIDGSIRKPRRSSPKARPAIEPGQLQPTRAW